MAVVAVVRRGEAVSSLGGGGVGRRGRRRRRALGREEGREVRNVALAERGRDGRHLRIDAALVAVEQELPVEVDPDLAGDRRDGRVRGIAVQAVAGGARDGLATARFEIGGERGEGARRQHRQGDGGGGGPTGGNKGQ